MLRVWALLIDNTSLFCVDARYNPNMSEIRIQIDSQPPVDHIPDQKLAEGRWRFVDVLTRSKGRDVPILTQLLSSQYRVTVNEENGVWYWIGTDLTTIKRTYG